MKKVERIFKIAIAHIWNSITITIAAIIVSVVLIISGDFHQLGKWWTESMPDMCEKQNRLYSTYWKTGEIDHSIFKGES